VRRFAGANVCSLDVIPARRRGRLGRHNRPTIGYCIAAPPKTGAGEEILIPVQASYAAPGGSFARAEDLRFIAGEGSSRVVENLRLGPLGLGAQILHLTLLYTGGIVRIEGALLTPGAITIK
jgi:hypothetical protein